MINFIKKYKYNKMLKEEKDLVTFLEDLDFRITLYEQDGKDIKLLYMDKGVVEEKLVNLRTKMVDLWRL